MNGKLRIDKKDWGISNPSDVNSYPEVPTPERPTIASRTAPVPEVATLALEDDRVVVAGVPGSNTTCMVGPFRIEFASRKSRCNLTNTETMETAFAKVNERVCGGEVEFLKNEDGRWVCRAWDLIITFPEGDGNDLTLDWNERGVLVRLRV